MKKYLVTYVTKYNCKEHFHERIIDTDNAKEARKIFDQDYDKGILRYPGTNYPHPFRVKVSLIHEKA